MVNNSITINWCSGKRTCQYYDKQKNLTNCKFLNFINMRPKCFLLNTYLEMQGNLVMRLPDCIKHTRKPKYNTRRHYDQSQTATNGNN
jgi:hypothetical protein